MKIIKFVKFLNKINLRELFWRSIKYNVSYYNFNKFDELDNFVNFIFKEKKIIF